MEEEDQEAIERLLEEDKAERLNADDFRSDFISDLTSDLKILRNVLDMWQDIRRDPKWDAFRSVLTSVPRLKKAKIIVFTESQETASYLAERVGAEIDPRVILFTGLSSEQAHRDVIDNFDADAFRPSDEYRILISTEVLSEGVN